MGMRPIDIIAISGKTQDAAQAQQTSLRAHGNLQDQIAVQQTARAERASEQVSAAAPEDRLELSAQGDGGTAGGGADRHEDSPEDGSQDAPPPDAPAERHIDFFA